MRSTVVGCSGATIMHFGYLLKTNSETLEVIIDSWRSMKTISLDQGAKAEHPSVICFLYSVYMQKVVLVPSARIFLAEDRKIIAPCKLPSLERS